MGKNTMFTSPLAEASSEHYRRSSPLVILNYLTRAFAIASTGKVLGLLISSSGGAVLSLYVLSALQTFGVHWFLRLLVVCFCVLIVQLAISVFKYLTLQFRYDDKKITAKKGFRTRETLDFEWFNVRSIRVTQSMFQRSLNLASVTLVTAGSSKNTIEIPYIPHALALEWEQNVKEQRLQGKESASAETETGSFSAESVVSNTHPDRKFLHKLRLRELVRASLANGNILADALFGFFVLGVGYCLYRFIYQILMLAPSIFELGDSGPFQLLRSQVSATFRDLPMNFVADTTALFEVFQKFTGIVETQSSQGQLFFFISCALVLSILFYMINRIWYVIKHFNFELAIQGIQLQAEEGLTTKRRLTIRRDRVQSTSFRANIVEQSMDRGNVVLDSASNLDFRIPFVTVECADRILRTLTEEEDTPINLTPRGQRFTPIHVLSLIQKLVIQVVLLLPLTLILVATFIPITRGVIWPYSLLLLGYAVIKIYVGWRRRGYIVNDDFLLQKEGGFSWSFVKVAPLNKVQSMSIKQSWIQRIRNRATIRFNFASGTQSIPFLSLTVAEAMRRTVERRIRGDSEVTDEIGEDETLDEWNSLPTKYIVSRMIGKALTSVLVLVPLFSLIAWGMHSWFSVSYELLGWILAPTWGALAIWRVVVVLLKVPKYRYSYGKDDIVVKESFLATETESVRYSRLQSVSTSNGLINGFFGLCDLKLYTAEDEVVVCGLDKREAIKLREYIAMRMIELSSIGTDALTMVEQEQSSLDSEESETTRHESTPPVDSTLESGGIVWRKFSGWTREILTRLVFILIGFPLTLGALFIYVYSTKDFWIQEFGENLFAFLASWPFCFGIWCFVSLCIGLHPFIAIPRKGFSVSVDALRFKKGWLWIEHHFVPLTRIQNVSLSATIYDRMFKLSTVKISTASDDELELEYLSVPEAEELREQLQTD